MVATRVESSTVDNQAGVPVRVAVWAQYEAVADAMRTHLTRAAPAVRAVRLVHGPPAPRAVDVLLALRPEMSGVELASLRRARIPVVQLSDSAMPTSAWHRVLPAQTPLPTIARAVLRAASVEVPEPAPPTALSSREHETVVLFAQGRSLLQVAEHLGVAPESVRTYLRRARAKLAADGHPAGTRERLVELQHLGVLPTMAPRGRR